jgi:alkylhydroperoxidase/carboxymuconolactone decarboxylase family protein YurZ
MNGGPLDSIKRLDNEFFASITKSREWAFSQGSMPVKYKLLMAMALDAAHGAVEGVKNLTKQAIENGATQAEIKETLRVVQYICGVGSIYVAGNALKDVL